MQETRWKGNSARLIGEGYKLFYTGESSGRNGVGIIMSEKMWEGVVEVRRKSSRLMRAELVYEGERLNVISAYAPQVGSSREEKEKVWEEFDEVMSECGRGVKVVVGGDLNGHVDMLKKIRMALRSCMGDGDLVRGTRKERQY